MKLFSILSLLTFCGMAISAEMQNGRIRFEESDVLKQTEKTIVFPTFIEQKSGDYLVIEGEEFSSFAPTKNENRLAFRQDCSNGCAVVNARRLTYDFSITEPGEYQVWIRAFFPLQDNYNHKEQMDDGDAKTISDSVNHEKLSKTEKHLYSKAFFLEPNFWHWTPNFSYNLAKGKHHWNWGKTAWCGGCLLDKIVLIRKNSSVKPETADKENRMIRSPESGVLISRRIRTEKIASWQFEYAAEPGDGLIIVEYTYDEKTYHPLKSRERYFVDPGQGEYLWIRIRMKNAPQGKRSPIVYHYNFRFEKKHN